MPPKHLATIFVARRKYLKLSLFFSFLQSLWFFLQEPFQSKKKKKLNILVCLKNPKNLQICVFGNFPNLLTEWGFNAHWLTDKNDLNNEPGTTTENSIL